MHRRPRSLHRAVLLAPLLIAAVLLARPAAGQPLGPDRESFAWIGGYVSTGAAGPLPYSLYPPMTAAGVSLLGGAAAQGRHRGFVAGRIGTGVFGYPFIDGPVTPLPFVRVGGSFGAMSQPHGQIRWKETVLGDHSVAPGRKPGFRFCFEPSFFVVPAVMMVGASVELKFAAVIW